MCAACLGYLCGTEEGGHEDADEGRRVPQRLPPHEGSRSGPDCCGYSRAGGLQRDIGQDKITLPFVSTGAGCRLCV
jgi:hypothetical protein